MNSFTIDAVGYGLGNLYDEVVSKGKASVVFTFDEGSWNGQTVIQFKVKDLK